MGLFSRLKSWLLYTMRSIYVQSPGRVRNKERESGLAAARHSSQTGLKSVCRENCGKTRKRMIIDYIVSDFFSVILVFLILTATIVVLFHLNNRLDKAEQIPQDVIKESNNNKEVTANNRNHRVKFVYWFQLIKYIFFAEIKL